MTPAPRIRLVVLLEDLEFGGTQRYAVQLLQELDRRWFAPVAWVLRGGDDFADAVRAAGVDVIRLSEGRSVGPRALLRLATRLRRERPDVLYTLTALPNIWGRLFAGLMRIRVVSGYRSLRPGQYERLLHRFSTRIIANAAAVADPLTGELGIDRDRIAVVPNGVDAAYFTPDEASRSTHPLVVCVARLVPDKDIPTLVEAFRLVQEQVPGARLEIIGQGPFPGKPAPNVHVLQGAKDIRSHLRRAWVYAMASRSEASPNAILEAMACGLPVVATGVGGVPELVEDGRTGRLVPPRDPAALGAALVELLCDPSLRASMGREGRRRASSRFGATRMVRQTETILREVAQRGSTWTATADGRIPPELRLGPEDGPTVPGEVVIERGRFRPDRSVQRVGAATLSVFLPSARRRTGAAVIVCPGGAYTGVTLDKEGYDVARWLTSMGVAGLVLKYRLPPSGPTRPDRPWPLEDVVRALEVTREHAAAWHIDLHRIGLMGFSAGGHMAAYASGVDPGVAFVVLAYPVISMDEGLTHKGSRVSLLGKRPTADTIRRYSLEHRVTARTAPTFIVHARDDAVVKVANAECYAAALREAGVPHECFFAERGGHGFALGVPGEETGQWPERCMAWLRSQGVLDTTGKPVTTPLGYPQ